MTEQEKAEKFVKSEPPLNKWEMEQINKLFPAYIFRRTRTAEVWTSCCGRHAHLGESPAERAILYAEHQREPRNYGDPRPGPEKMCPFCGEPVVIKELGRTGRRDNLCNYKRAVVLRWYRGVLWARAYELEKRYGSEYDLTAKPRGSLVGLYRFRLDLAEAATSGCGGYPFRSIARQDGPLTGGHWNIHNPFHPNFQYGSGYDVIGMEEIEKSPLRYCGAESYVRKYGTESTIRFLTAACIYPRQIEMLMKSGMENMVHDLVDRCVKNAAAIDWEQPNLQKAIGLSKQEMQKFLNTKKDLAVLAKYKTFRRHGVSCDMSDLSAMKETLGDDLFNKTTARAWKAGLSPIKLMKYLLKVRNQPYVRRAAELWCDYIDAAILLGYDIRNDIYRTPKLLHEKHDQCCAAAQAIQEEKLTKEAGEQEKKREKNTNRRYAYENERWLIRAPHSAAEIVREGKTLKHCVGGYADRHIKGTCTILFLRDKSKPAVPLITIEMRGNQLIQIHGYRNECEACPENPKRESPQKLYKDILDPWLEWVQNGSKRNKDGTPKLPNKKKGAAA